MTYKHKATRDRKDQLPNRLIVTQVIRMEEPQTAVVYVKTLDGYSQCGGFSDDVLSRRWRVMWRLDFFLGLMACAISGKTFQQHVGVNFEERSLSKIL